MTNTANDNKANDSIYDAVTLLISGDDYILGLSPSHLYNYTKFVQDRKRIFTVFQQGCPAYPTKYSAVVGFQKSNNWSPTFTPI